MIGIWIILAQSPIHLGPVLSEFLHAADVDAVSDDSEILPCLAALLPCQVRCNCIQSTERSKPHSRSGVMVGVVLLPGLRVHHTNPNVRPVVPKDVLAEVAVLDQVFEFDWGCFVVFCLSVRKRSIATVSNGRDATGIVGELCEIAVCRIEWIWRVCSLVCSLNRSLGWIGSHCMRQIDFVRDW